MDSKERQKLKIDLNKNKVQIGPKLGPNLVRTVHRQKHKQHVHSHKIATATQ